MISTGFTSWGTSTVPCALFPGHVDVWLGETPCQYHHGVVDNVSLLPPELLVEVIRLIVESGHAMAR